MADGERSCNGGTATHGHSNDCKLYRTKTKQFNIPQRALNATTNVTKEIWQRQTPHPPSSAIPRFLLASLARIALFWFLDFKPSSEIEMFARIIIKWNQTRSTQRKCPHLARKCHKLSSSDTIASSHITTTESVLHFDCKNVKLNFIHVFVWDFSMVFLRDTEFTTSKCIFGWKCGKDLWLQLSRFVLRLGEMVSLKSVHWNHTGWSENTLNRECALEADIVRFHKCHRMRMNGIRKTNENEE